MIWARAIFNIGAFIGVVIAVTHVWGGTLTLFDQIMITASLLVMGLKWVIETIKEFAEN